MTRILIFSPYALWSVHTIYERTIAEACRVRGADLEYILCDGLLPECDLHWDSKSNSPRPFDLCQRCQGMAKQDVEDHGFAFRRLGEFVSQAEREAVFSWAQGTTPPEFRSASFEGVPVGQWVLSSVISYFRQYPPDLSDWHVASVYRGFLYSAAIVVTGLRNYLDANEVDSALLFNGRQSVTRVALELFRQRGIRVLTHERAEYNRGHINVKLNAHCMRLEPFQAFWGEWAQVPLKYEALEAAQKWLIDRQTGTNLAWIPFNRSSERDPSLRAKMGASLDKRLWVLFTSSTDETAGDPDLKGPFESQHEWIREVVQWVASRDDVQLVVKVHPNLGGNAYIGKATDELRQYQEMKLAALHNITIVLPEDTVNVYALAEEADVGLTFGSIIGLEMAMLGKPVLLASRAIYENCSKILTVRSKESLAAKLEKCLHVSTDREIQREAFRLAYYYICEFELPFPAITVHDIFDARPNYASAEDLAPGKDASLDRICSCLIDGKPLFDSPTAEQLARDTADEDVFFDQLANPSKTIASPAPDRRSRMQSLAESTKTLLRRLPFGAGRVLMNLGSPTWRAYMKTLETESAEGAHRRN